MANSWQSGGDQDVDASATSRRELAMSLLRVIPGRLRGNAHRLENGPSPMSSEPLDVTLHNVKSQLKPAVIDVAMIMHQSNHSVPQLRRNNNLIIRTRE